MALSKHLNADRLIQASKDHKAPGAHSSTDHHAVHGYGARYGTEPIPKYRLPSKGTDAEATYQLLHDELTLDGNPALNLASFVHTWMPKQADQLMMENISKNLIDQDEYPMTQVIHTRCVSILADLWHAPSTQQAIGTATTGSSEAIQLGGLAMKRLWQEKRKAAGKSIHEPGPNIVMGANAQVALEKFARYFDVEMRLVPISEESHYRLDPKRAMQYVDENTIGVYVILGSTYTGHYEPVKEMADLLDEYEARTGNSVPIHVDAASGGFIAPFATPKLEWDFKIPRVVSINTSGHKFGLSYVGVGWVVWRSKQFLPKDLIFELHYLGSVEYSFSLNFSRPAHPIIAQYFNFVHLGFEGYRNVALQDLANARLLSRALEKSGLFYVLSDIHRPQTVGALASAAQKTVGINEANVENYSPGLPVVSFRFTDEFRQQNPDIQQKWVQVLLRAKGWIVPNYELAPDLESVEILRVVVRENLSAVMIDRLVADIIEIVEGLVKSDTPTHALSKMSSGVTTAEHHHGGLDKGSGSKSSGTYAKQC
ncbi:glutamate decarboxylase [Dichomitus squalens LYAD-421 SS1]|uniref:Glutamate decarboxylase n=1 Tax=Dichomitus squalens TaxID=114155 RepID=A0A4V2KA21_9APHY|nr:glutamate decarboxylase [Dichomitus squalens LYAD-421 SS1]EJF65670.1 glutamate decarboxylase [Dichomitus squalens LYAD-421 SS1]TBU66058.1 glutamate decarboxylase [Dichomitus squalens]